RNRKANIEGIAMAVAVKNAPASSSASLFDRVPVGSLVGAIYVLGSFALALKGLAFVWWGVLGFEQDSIFAWGALIVLQLLAVGGLGYVGTRLLGPKPAPGVKAGTFVVVLGLLIIALLTKYVSLWVEYWSFDRDLFSRGIAIGLTALFAVLLIGV